MAINYNYLFPDAAKYGKNFRSDVKILLSMLKDHHNFAFSKYADGEYGILLGNKIGNKEFSYDPENKKFQRDLIASFEYRHPDYYIGIGCECCMGMGAFLDMLERSGSDGSNITWANIFVNSNYEFYKNNFIPEYNNHDVIIVCNENASLDDLPFQVKKDFRCKNTAWENGGYDLIENIKNYIFDNKIKNHLFLFCAGPFGNILAHQLHSFNQNNIYLDIGSTLDLYLFSIATRGYLQGAATSSKTCIWSC